MVSTTTLSNSPEGVHVSGGYAYVAHHLGGISVIDVRDPYNPVYTDQITVTPAVASEVWVEGNYAYLGVTDGLYVYDVSDPNAITEETGGRNWQHRRYASIR